MTLGKRIAQLRMQRGISQIELAEQLAVSRQAISKWETDGSVPELEKLIQLSEIFDVTLDELIKGEGAATPPPAPAPAPTPQPVPEPKAASNTQQIIGVILLCFGAMACLLLTVMGAFLEGMIIASPFFLCGLICLLVRRHAGLWCAWALLAVVDIFMRYATGITWSLALLTFRYEPSWNILRLAFAWVELLTFVVMITLTVRRLGKTPLEPSGKVKLWMIAGVVALLVLSIPVQLNPLSWLPNAIRLTRDWIKIPVLTALLTALRRILRWHKEQIH